VSRRAPRPLGVALASLDARLAPASTLAAVQRCWESVVGEAIARHAQPIAERAGVLEVACDEAVWAAELDLLGPQLVAALRAVAGCAGVRSIRARAGPTRHRA
jgi:predicted nucleic acid-binding Zn ribbon protein